MSTPPPLAPILSLEEFAALRDAKGEEFGTVVCTSGGYDPIHPGHITCIIDSVQFGDTMVVVVNGDGFLRAKKGRPFQDVDTRCAIVSAIRGVDYVVKFEIEGDTTVGPALTAVRPHIFTKGGDRIAGKTLPASEEEACRKFNIKIIDGVGRDKVWSSSDFLADWVRFKQDSSR